MDYLDQLNDVQRSAVLNTEGPSLIIAGAGSGKTRVLTYRIAHLLATGVKPWNILALTFTNKAAREMRSRIESLVGEDSQSLMMGTFHSIFSKILRYESERLGFASSFTIYDTADSKSLVKSIIKEFNLDEKIYKPNHVMNRISMAKNNLITSDVYRANGEITATDAANKMPLIGTIYERYATRCKQSSAMDFDDLLLYTNILFRDNPDILDKYQERFKYILVDEYQDTNFAQYLIIKKLAQIHNNISVVGDDAQSIYSFRGAKIENILNFKNDYPHCQIFKLEQNYRSTQNIVAAANSLIKKNEHQIPKDVFSTNDEGMPIKVMESITDIEESYNIVREIFNDVNSKHLHYKDIAILYRTNAQSRVFEEALRKRNFPYRIYGGLSFYQRKEIKDLIAYMRLVVNPDDGEAVKRVINYPARGIGETTLMKVIMASVQQEVSLWHVLKNLRTNPCGIANKTIEKIESFIKLIEGFTVLAQNNDAYDTVLQMIDILGIKNEFSNSDDPEDKSRLENIEELLRGISDHVATNSSKGEDVSLASFLENVALITDQDNKNTENLDSVTLMTIHSAKGLEFPHVYIVGVEEGIFPSKMSVNSQSELEEERRLFYVAITRGMNKVVVSYSKNRAQYGKDREAVAPSRFIKDIDEKYISRPQVGVMRQQPTFSSSSFGQSSRPAFASKVAMQNRLAQIQQRSDTNFVPSPASEIRAGVSVLHQQFGEGRVLQMGGDDADNRYAIIFFHKVGEKKMLLKFAKLQVKKND